MVDFNNNSTISVPATEVEKISILQRRFDTIEAIEDYKKRQFQGAGASIAFVRSRLLSFFLQIQAMAQRQFEEQAYKDIEQKVFDSKDEKELIKVFYDLSQLLDRLRVTKIDNIRPYDQQDIEAENKIKGFS